MTLARSNVDDSQNNQDCVHGMPVPERCGNDYTLIATKVSAGVYVGTASAARGEGCLSGSHHGQRQVHGG